MAIVLCEACMRHVRVASHRTEGRSVCVFCGAPVVWRAPLRGPRRSRAAVLVTTALVACAARTELGDRTEEDAASNSQDGAGSDASKKDAAISFDATTPLDATNPLDAFMLDSAPKDAHQDYSFPPPPYGGSPPPDDEDQ